jgi:hypothetical protein
MEYRSNQKKIKLLALFDRIDGDPYIEKNMEANSIAPITRTSISDLHLQLSVI